MFASSQETVFPLVQDGRDHWGGPLNQGFYYTILSNAKEGRGTNPSSQLKVVPFGRPGLVPFRRTQVVPNKADLASISGGLGVQCSLTPSSSEPTNARGSTPLAQREIHTPRGLPTRSWMLSATSASQAARRSVMGIPLTATRRDHILHSP